MTDNTSELRAIAEELIGGAVTEEQQETPGSLADRVDVDRRLREVVGQMQERYEFETDLSRTALARVARGFHDDEADEQIADDLDIDPEVVFDARLDLHLVDEADRETPPGVDGGELRTKLTQDPEADTEQVAAAGDADPEAVERAVKVARTDVEARIANQRFRTQFEELLTDADLSRQHADGARDDGLQEATEGLDSGPDVSF